MATTEEKLWQGMFWKVQGEAGQKYNRLYDNKLYSAAVASMPQPVVERANFLIDAARALCGDPLYKVDWNHDWSMEELEFLSAFVWGKEDGPPHLARGENHA